MCLLEQDLCLVAPEGLEVRDPGLESRGVPGRGRPPGSQMTELADLKMAGALEAVDGVLAQVDSGAVTPDEAIERVLDARVALRNHEARSLPGNPLASVDRASCLVVRRPSSSVRRRWRW